MHNEPIPIEWKSINFVSISTHAEMNALLNYLYQTGQNTGRRRKHGIKKWKLKMPSTIIVVNLDRENRFKNSRPCDHCLFLLKYYGIKYVIYSTGNEDPEKAFCKEEVKYMEYKGTSSGNRRNTFLKK